MALPFPPSPGGGPAGPAAGLPLPPGLGGGGGGGGVPGQADTPQVSALINKAADILSQALGQEKDPEDKAMIADLIAKCHKFAGSQQKMIDTATGAGPGVKLLRKASGPGPGY